MSVKRFVAWFDTHYGFEHRRGRTGRLQNVPVHSMEAIKPAMQFVADFKPDAFVFGGDNLNCGFISTFHRGKPRLTEGFRGRVEYEGFDRDVLKPLEKILGPKCIKIWLMGNHEAWTDKFLDENPTLEGLVEPHEYLRLAQRGWNLYAYGETAQLGKLNFAHGDVVLRGGGGYISANCAKKAVENYGRNIRIGHRHTWQVHTKTTPVDQKDFHTGIVVPSLCTRSPEYTRNNPNDFVNGFLFGYVDEASGHFSDFVMIVNQGRFYWNGREYKGRGR